jgi:ribonuclease PH
MCSNYPFPKVGDALVLDPNGDEEEKQRGGIMVSFMPNLKKMTQFYQFGELSHTEISQVFLFPLSPSLNFLTEHFLGH